MLQTFNNVALRGILEWTIDGVSLITNEQGEEFAVRLDNVAVAAKVKTHAVAVPPKNLVVPRGN